MDKVHAEPLTWEHVRSITLRAGDSRLLTNMNPELVRSLYTQGQALAFVTEDGEVLMCVGVVPQWTGVGYGWLLATPHTFLRIKTLLPLIRNAIQFVMQHGYRRIHIYVDHSWAAARRFAYHLGFQYVTSLEDYGPNGETYIIMALVKRKTHADHQATPSAQDSR